MIKINREMSNICTHNGRDGETLVEESFTVPVPFEDHKVTIDSHLTTDGPDGVGIKGLLRGSLETFSLLEGLQQ